MFNAVLISIVVMLILSFFRVQIIISLLVAALVAGLLGGLSLEKTIVAFNTGITHGASIALSYALLGAFAVAISTSGLPQILADIAVKKMQMGGRKSVIKWFLIILIALISISSQNIIPIHIAFIPLLIPPLLYVMVQLKLDRRMIASVIVFGLVTPYMFFPIGFGEIFLNQILLSNIAKSGMDVSHINIMHAMGIPALGMVFGLFIAIFFSYSKPRKYQLTVKENTPQTVVNTPKEQNRRKAIIVSLIAIVLAFTTQLYTNSMMFGALIGFLLFLVTGAIKWDQADHVFTKGIKMMAMIGFIMISAQGFAEVLKETNKIVELVQLSADLFAGSKMAAAFAMMLVGLVITLGIGSSFSTVPIIAAIYVPLCIQMGFSPMATVCLIGAAGAIGDAGSPASDSTLAVTGGLNIDYQHDHIRDTVIPTFLHFNVPLFIAGWIGALVL